MKYKKLTATQPIGAIKTTNRVAGKTVLCFTRSGQKLTLEVCLWN